MIAKKDIEIFIGPPVEDDICLEVYPANTFTDVQGARTNQQYANYLLNVRRMLENDISFIDMKLRTLSGRTD